MSKLTKILAVILMLLAAALAALAWWLGRQPAGPAAPAPVLKTAGYASVAAARNLEKGKPIAADGVKLVDLPMPVGGAYRDAGSVIGKVPSADIAAGALITEHDLAHGLALKLTAGERAVAVPVDEIVGAGNKIEAGDYVDVFVALKQGNEIGSGQSRLLASRWRVLAYGAAVLGETQSGGPAPALGQAAPPSQARTAVLAVPLEQANRLFLALQNGKLTLALRHPDDDGSADAELFPEPNSILSGKPGLSPDQRTALKSADNQAFSGMDLSSWAGGAHGRAAPAAGRPAAGGAAAGKLEIIKGTQREYVGF
jgi:pilus assembly protein CpaB